MGRGALIVVVVSLLMGAGTAQAVVRVHELASFARMAAPTQTFTVVNRTAMPERAIRAWERATAIASTALSMAWAVPQARFGPGGWPIYIVRQSELPPGFRGVHFFGPAIGVPNAAGPWAQVRSGMAAYGDTFSHEVFEMLVDPRGLGLEVCDPVERAPSRTVHIGRRVVWVSAFVRPGDPRLEATPPRSQPVAP